MLSRAKSSVTRFLEFSKKNKWSVFGVTFTGVGVGAGIGLGIGFLLAIGLAVTPLGWGLLIGFGAVLTGLSAYFASQKIVTGIGKLSAKKQTPSAEVGVLDSADTTRPRSQRSPALLRVNDKTSTPAAVVAAQGTSPSVRSAAPIAEREAAQLIDLSDLSKTNVGSGPTSGSGSATTEGDAPKSLLPPTQTTSATSDVLVVQPEMNTSSPQDRNNLPIAASVSVSAVTLWKPVVANNDATGPTNTHEAEAEHRHTTTPTLSAV